MTATLRSLGSLRSLVLARTGADEAKRTARGFVDHLNYVLNRTVSKSRLTAVLERGTSPPHFDVFRRVGAQVTPLELNGTSLMLLFQQKVEVADDHCRTLTYTYRLQRTSDHRTWLCRWEYFRKPPKPDYRYPLSHLHVSAAPVEGHDMSDKHFPTDRVPMELVSLHLIEEWGVQPLSDDYRQILQDSIEGFATRRTDR